MSDSVVKPVKDANGRSRQIMQSYQSVWIAHWMRSSCNAPKEMSNHDASGSEELDCANRVDNLTNGFDVSRPVKGLGVIETKTFGVVDEGPKMGCKNLRNEISHNTMFRCVQDTDDIQAFRPVFAHKLERGKAVEYKSGIQFLPFVHSIPAENKISSRGCTSLGECSSRKPPQWMETHSNGNDSCFQVPKFLKERLVESSSDIVPYIEKYKFDKEKAAVSPMINEYAVVSKQLTNKCLSHEHCHEYNQSADLVCQTKMDCRSKNTCYGEGDMCDSDLSTLGRDWFPKKLQNCVHDVESRFYTSVDSVEGTTGSCPMFSQTIHSLLITKKTDVNLSKGNDIFECTKAVAKFDGNMSTDLHLLSPFCGQCKQVKLQPLGHCISSEAKENVGDVKASKVTTENESSVEMDGMDMDSFKEKNSWTNLNSGSFSTAAIKDTNKDASLPPHLGVPSSSKVGCQQLTIWQPDINLELPALLGGASSSENTFTDFSETQSLEMERLSVHVEQPKRKSTLSVDDHLYADKGNIMVKRLKRSSSNSAHGTKSSNLAQNSSHGKMGEFFSRILKSSITSSEPNSSKHHSEESLLSDKSRDFLSKDNDIIQDPINKDKGLLLSHAWIQRWLRNGPKMTEMKPETMVVSELPKLRLAQKSLQKKQCPSIAAMALMRKAITGLQPCELQKRGPFTIWNTKGF
ncbi:UNVERIFIED_CONTAM: F-box protein [Sesamum angustifolium]|uniref:F-box protein n=1 Tax=Sesamum angustifolium TaxID=2727405 RepID=A0AAW2QCF2_9LAMI